MQWQEKYLRAEDEATLMAALNAAGLMTTDPETEEDTLVSATHQHQIVILGTLTESNGETEVDDEGNEYPVQVPVPGFHANLKVRNQALIDALSSVTISVDTPKVKWA